MLNDETYRYTYNADGIRASKTVNGVKREYILNGTQILGEIWSDETTIIYIYDAEGYAVGMLYRDSSYEANKFDAFFYERNLQGDIIAVYDCEDTKLVSYTYDAWGNVSITYSNGGDLTGAQYNPFTYRGYYRDAETGFYYLNSRYYDPKVGRFINADQQISNDLLGSNQFVYCGNNPVYRKDDGGEAWWGIVSAFVGGVVNSGIKIVSNVSSGQKWSDGLAGAFVGGAVSGFVLSTTGNLAAASYAGATAESFTNEVVSYTPWGSEENRKEFNQENILESVGTIILDTAIDGTIACVTGKLSDKIIPINKGWFKPKKLKSSLIGKYARLSHAQTMVEGFVRFCIDDRVDSFEQQNQMVKIYE